MAVRRFAEMSRFFIETPLVYRIVKTARITHNRISRFCISEHRISNFLLWQLAYSELYFTDTLWPDFDKDALDLAMTHYSSRQRRFGQTGEQLTHG